MKRQVNLTSNLFFTHFKLLLNFYSVENDVHLFTVISGMTPKEYSPPIPPETYLWEEVKRLKEKGGYPWTHLEQPPVVETTCKNNE